MADKPKNSVFQPKRTTAGPGFSIWERETWFREVDAVVVGIVVMVIFLTELTSNLATTATLLPVMAALALELGVTPVMLTVPVALAASCAFMLPVATPPNAIVYGSGMLTIPQMVKAGVIMNAIGIVLLSLVALFLAPLVLT